MWFPRSVDREHGGFHSHFTHDWQWAPSDGKFSVFQGRMTWVTSQVVMREPALKDEYLPFVKQGVDFLQNTMWDKQYGGFYWGLDDDGRVITKTCTASGSASTERRRRIRRPAIRGPWSWRRRAFCGPMSTGTTASTAGISSC